MPAAVLRLAVIAWCSAAALAAAGPMERTAPTRPGASSAARTGRLASLPVTRIRGVEFVSAREGAGLLGLHAVWHESTRKLTLADSSNQVELEADSREVMINGLRLFLGNPTELRGGVLYIGQTDFECALLARLRPALLGKPPARPRIIVLDPGHGGIDQGAENKPLGLKEKVLTLEVALRLEKLLKAHGYRVVLTRSDDRQLAPDKSMDFLMRAGIANRAKADLFLSIHFNSLFPDTKTSGTETFVFTPRTQRSTRAWSPGETDDTEREPAPVNRYDPWSALLAQEMHRAVIGSLRTFDRGQKTMHLRVLRALNCPGVLVESVFLSNDSEARLAATPAYRQRIAEALAAGIYAYTDALEALQPKSITIPAAPTPLPKS